MKNEDRLTDEEKEKLETFKHILSLFSELTENMTDEEFEIFLEKVKVKFKNEQIANA